MIKTIPGRVALGLTLACPFITASVLVYALFPTVAGAFAFSAAWLCMLTVFKPLWVAPLLEYGAPIVAPVSGWIVDAILTLTYIFLIMPFGFIYTLFMAVRHRNREANALKSYWLENPAAR